MTAQELSMRARIDALDWASTPLGGFADWPESLRTAVNICLASPAPGLVLAGSEARLLYNDPCALLLGADHPIALGQPAAEVWRRWWRDAEPQLAALTADGSEALPAPFGNRGESGSPLMLCCVPVGNAARLGFYATIDLSSETTAEDDPLGDMTSMWRLAKAEAERASAAKSRFLAAASHDLRQPFQAMRLFLGVLLNQLHEEAPRKSAELLEKSLSAGEALVNALLDISTLDAGNLQPKITTFRINIVLERLLGEFLPQAAEKGLKLKSHLFNLTVCTDPVLFERILRNFLTNAVRYTRQGGILVGVRRRGRSCRVEVWDTGFGVPEAERKRIFEEFHQLENPERDRNRGLGLGLAIVRRLAALLNTPVDLRSQVGRGSVFRVSVPLAQDQTARAASSNGVPAGANLDGYTVLVVDDDHLVLAGLEMALESWGCITLAAGTTAEVLAQLDRIERAPDVILSDLRLRNGQSGFDLIERVRKIYRRPIPAVVLTGETERSQLVIGRSRGYWFLNKPLDPAQLKTVLYQALQGANDNMTKS
ncbi:MAG: hybrid sensor histidine kinase/response regulator [Rhodospirillales bacterium]|nr:hybrid sensor histidine kinase/response regulator [Rhodospirillales bacterium]